jgi:N6-adenosine-specific RNA methylase IME4
MQYGTILADPPWPYHSPKAVVGNGGRGKEGADQAIQANVLQHYAVMPLEQIKALPIKKLILPNAHLYLWTTNAFMVEAHEVAQAWGFKPKTILTWAKMKKNGNAVSMKAGYWYRSASEHIVFAVRGKQRLLGMPAPTVYLIPRIKQHSVKPDFFYELIEKESPGPYLELFARKIRDGWDAWGNEIQSTVDLGDNIQYPSS